MLGRLVDGLFPTVRAGYRPPQIEVAWREFSVTIDEIARAVRGGRPNSAPGPDGIKELVWRKTPNAFLARVMECFDQLFRLGHFPDCWKTASLVLIPKAGDPAPAGEMPKARPIYLLNEAGKVLERVIVERLNQFMGTSRLASLHQHQFGFRRGSTTDALMLVKSLIKEATGSGRVCMIVSLDVTNAFNSVPHSSIRRALQLKKFLPYLRRMISSYLENRYVDYWDCHGLLHRKKVTAGVPQGSVLGPLL